MKGLLETKDSLLIPSVSTLVMRPYTFTLKTLLKPWPSSMTTCFVFMKKVHFHIYLSLFLPHYCCQTSKPVGCIERWLLCLLSSPERYPWKPPCTTLKTFWDLQGMFFFPSDQEWTALSQANYILQTYIAFITFNISLEQAMEVWCVNVLFQEKK